MDGRTDGLVQVVKSRLQQRVRVGPAGGGGRGGGQGAVLQPYRGTLHCLWSMGRCVLGIGIEGPGLGSETVASPGTGIAYSSEALFNPP